MDFTATLPAAQRLALAYAPSSIRPGWSGLLTLDMRLADTVRLAREPMLGQLRLAWWRDLLSREQVTWPQGEPLVRHIADHLAGIAPRLADLATGWEYLLSSDTLAPDQLSGYVAARAGAIAAATAWLCGLPEGTRAMRTAATWWVMGDTYSRLSDQQERHRLLDLADGIPLLEQRLVRTARPLAILAALGHRAVRQRAAIMEGRISALVALRVGIFGR